ncbi:hypothetical protein BS78_04G282400 [Paspalum vaginatum]|nr:hypothetical protein BS78_04G282400 [Paspalum vaginatum]
MSDTIPQFQFILPQPSLYIYKHIKQALQAARPNVPSCGELLATRARCRLTLSSTPKSTPMYSCEQDHTRYLQPCVAAGGRSLRQLSAQAQHHHPGEQQALRTAAAPVPAAGALQARRAKSKKHGASSRPSSSSSSRRSSTTVVATDVSNFRAMVQELTGFPPAAIFRPLPRRVHAAGPFVAAGQAGQGQGCGGGGEQQHGRCVGYSEPTVIANSVAAGGSGADAPAAMTVMPPQPQPPQPCVFDGLSDIGSPEFDSWGDLSME